MGVIDDIKKAGSEKKLLKITYRDLKGEITERITEPYEIRGSRYWGFCRTRDEIRHFIITGILETVVLDESYEPKWPVKV